MLFSSLLSSGGRQFHLPFVGLADMALDHQRASALVSSGPLAGARRG
jgi:hypothetical protein